MKNNKTARPEMRIRPGDKAKITKATKRSGVSAAEYVVGCRKKHPPKVKPPDEFWNLLQDTSDRLCREYELSVISHPHKAPSRPVWLDEKSGKPTRYNLWHIC